MRIEKMTSPSESALTQIDRSLASLANTVAKKEREACAELVQQMADSEEDQVRKDLLNDVATAIRRMPNAKY
jgi:transcription initiation factor IIF auxiliary subunit